MKEGDPIEKFEAVCLKETEDAILVELDDIPGVHTWVPKSQLHDDSEVYQEGDKGTLVVSNWIARKKEWV